MKRTQERSGAGRAIRVVHVLRSLNTGGQEVLCARLVERLDSQRFLPSVVAMQAGGWLQRRLEAQGIPVYCLNESAAFSPSALLRLAALLADLRADIIHPHNRNALMYAGLASLLVPRAKLVFTKHGVSLWGERHLVPIGRMLMRRSAAVVTVSEDIARPLAPDGWVRPERLHVVPNGVDTEAFHPSRGSRRRRTRPPCCAPLPWSPGRCPVRGW
jgi:glycosyltransferase involved in cell wall biosynthesis